jgi:hypothetical protein
MGKPGSEDHEEKFPSRDQLDPDRRETILDRSKNGELACAVAFQIVESGNIPADEIGLYANQMKIRLVKCQLGLFGYHPDKKIVKKIQNVDESLKKAIKDKIMDNRLSCIQVWQIASELGLPKLSVSNACETLSIKIHSCQLGAF